MYLKLIKTYSGPLGVFPKDDVRDAHPDTAKILIEQGFAEKCDPPWDAQKDKDAARVSAAEESLVAARVKVGTLDSMIQAANTEFEGLIADHKAKKQAEPEFEDKVKKAQGVYEKAKPAAAKADASDKVKKAANDALITLHQKIVDHDRASLQLQAASARIVLATAEHGLIGLNLKEAEAVVAKGQEKLDAMKETIAQKKAPKKKTAEKSKDQDDAKDTKTEQSAETPATTEQADNDAEGQAADSGAAGN